MCARYSLTKEQITMIIGEIEVIFNIGARYNIAPTQIVPAILTTPPNESVGRIHDRMPFRTCKGCSSMPV